METQEPAKSTAAPRPSRLANASFGLGIGAGLSEAVGMLLLRVDCDIAENIYLFAVVCGLLAMALGVAALLWIRKAHGNLVGIGRANAGFLLGIVSIIALMAIPFIPHRIITVISKPLSEVHALAFAVEHYQTEYDKYPGQDSTNSDHLYSGDECRLLLAALRGSNLVWNGKPSNPRGIVFLSVDERSLVTTNIVGTAQVGEIADPWGNRYEVVADWNGDNKIDAPLADGEAVQRRGVAVWSYGPKGKPIANPADKTHICSWR